MPIAAQSRGFWTIREVFSLQLDFYRPKGSTCFDGVAVALGSWTRDQRGFRRIRKPNLSRNESVATRRGRPISRGLPRSFNLPDARD